MDGYRWVFWEEITRFACGKLSDYRKFSRSFRSELFTAKTSAEKVGISYEWTGIGGYFGGEITRFACGKLSDSRKFSRSFRSELFTAKTSAEKLDNIRLKLQYTMNPFRV
jgi:hypothetical protein